jgi:hypothetical protein
MNLGYVGGMPNLAYITTRIALCLGAERGKSRHDACRFVGVTRSKEATMKKIFAPAWLTAWFMGIIPDGMFGIGKKTPWYRRSWMANAPWLGAALMVPFALFLAWRGVSLLLQREAKEQR